MKKQKIFYKNREEIALIKESAEILAKVHGEVAKLIRPGMQTKEIDRVAEEFIYDHNALPSFKGYATDDKHVFPNALCISVNEAVVHGIPSNYTLREGDVVSIDCGVFYKGFHSDSAYTHAVGEISAETAKLLKVTKEALYLGIEQVVIGKRIGDIGFAIQRHVERNHFSIIRELVGHGIGRNLHEDPEVPNYGKRGNGQVMREGLVIAIEPMVNLGSRNIKHKGDGWTIVTADRKSAAHFEHTVALIDGKCEILTNFKYIEEAIEVL